MYITPTFWPSVKFKCFTPNMHFRIYFICFFASKCLCKTYVFIGVKHARTCVLLPTNSIYPQQNQPQQSYPQVYPQPMYNYHAHALRCLVACCCIVQCVPHSINTLYKAHTSDITKDYIYINIIYYINYKYANIKQQL